MKTQDQRKKMKMASGGVAEDVLGGQAGFEKRLAQIGEFAKGIATEEDRGILEGILQSRQAQEFLTNMGGVAIPKSRAIRKARPIQGAKPPRMD
jgi:hypothetical protein|tara:strand:+ start:382 stop:663 length:282 start_codon:yes stop_codon:yes gene_type:complete